MENIKNTIFQKKQVVLKFHHKEISFPQETGELITVKMKSIINHTNFMGQE